MKTCQRIAAFVVLVCGPVLAHSDQPADKQDDGEIAAKALVDGAIKALGGAERLGKIQAVSAQVKAEIVAARNIAIHFSATARGAEQIRIEVDTLQKNPFGALLIGNGDKSWIKGTDPKDKFNDKLNPVKEILFDAGMSHDMYAIQLTSFLPTLKGKDFKLSAAGEIQIDERDAVGFRVSRAGRPDVNIYLDKKTSMPIKCELRLRSDKTNTEFTHDIFLRDFKDVDGVKQFTKIVVNKEGTKIFEAEFSNVQFLEKVDAKIFAEP